MKRIPFLLGLLAASSAAFAQIIPGSVSIGRPDFDAVNVGYSVPATTTIVDDLPVANNRIYTDGDYWSATDTMPTGMNDGYTTQIVTDPAGLENAAADYLQLTARRRVQMFVCRDTRNTGGYAAGWVDTGLQVVRGAVTFACLAKTFAAGSVDVPGNDGDPDTDQFIVFARDPAKGISVLTADTGEVTFTQASYLDTEGATVSVGIARTGGTSGTCEVNVIEDLEPGAIELDTGSLPLTWDSGQGGTQFVDVVLSEVGENTTSSLSLSAAVNCEFGDIINVEIQNLDDDGATPSAAEYFISGTGTGDGLTEGNPAPPSFMNTIQHPGGPGHVIVNFSGTVRNFTYRPAFGGLSESQKIKICSDGTGLWLGPSSGSMESFFEVDERFIDVGSDCGDGRLEMYGECNPAAGSLPTGCRVRFQGYVTADDVTIGAYIHNTQGWNGLLVGSADRLDINGAILDTHGATNNGSDDPDDIGDMVVIGPADSIPSSRVVAIRNSQLSRVGHNPLDVQGGSSLISGNFMYNRWDAYPGFTNQGNRTGTIRRLSRYTVLENNILRTNGIPGDTNHPPIQSIDGRNTLVRWNFVIDSEDECFQAVAQSSYRHSWGQRIAHNLIYDCEGPGIWAWHLNAPEYLFGNMKVFNNIIVDTAYNNRGFSEDGALVFRCGANVDITDWRDELEVKGNLFWGIGSSSKVYIQCPGPSAGNMTVAQYEAAYPDNFAGNVFADPQWVAATKTPTSLAEAYAAFATMPGSPVRDAAWPLTTATNSGTGAIVLEVEDFTWYTDGHGFGPPITGPDAGGYQIRNITKGWTAVIDDVNYSNGRIMLNTLETWDAGDEFGYVSTDIGPVSH